MGMFLTPYFIAISWLESTSTLAMTALSLYSSANSSTSGAIMRQGPHHAAQKSIMTGLSVLSTSSKFEVVISTAMFSLSLGFIRMYSLFQRANALPKVL